MATTDSTTLGRGLIHLGEEGARAQTVAWGMAFVLAMAVSAHIMVPVPLTSVPITLQVLVVLLSGAILGPWGGAGAMAGYLALGAVGAPVFSGAGAGLVWLAGPTGGYLLAFPLAAAVTGVLCGRGGAGVVRSIVGMSAGLAVIYLGGVAQLGIITGLGLGELMAMGVVPFLVGDLIKVAIGVLLLKGIRQRAGG